MVGFWAGPLGSPFPANPRPGPGGGGLGLPGSGGGPGGGGASCPAHPEPNCDGTLVTGGQCHSCEPPACEPNVVTVPSVTKGGAGIGVSDSGSASPLVLPYSVAIKTSIPVGAKPIMCVVTASEVQNGFAITSIVDSKATVVRGGGGADLHYWNEAAVKGLGSGADEAVATVNFSEGPYLVEYYLQNSDIDYLPAVET